MTACSFYTMRISSQLLRSTTLQPLHSVEYLDLSNLGLVSLERLELCPRVQTVILRGNKIETVPDLSCCPELWKIDLANNVVRSLEGLCRVAAFGTLILSNNDLDWNELQKIRHVYILDLCLHGNQKLEVDAYYRMHVIDSLPLVWMLDGRIITSAERVQVEQFFRDSALSDRPVRHKLPKNQFVPSLLKNILVTGVFGKKSEHLMRRFPCKETLNVDLDKRRLMYLAYSLQQEVNLFMKNTLKEKVKPSQLIENLIRYRNEDKEKCNMLLLMLVASLEFAVPSVLVQQTLDVARLGKIGNVDTMDLFMLPREIRCRVVSLLLGGVKIERDQHVVGGLYNRLYLCLYDLVADLMRVANGDSIIKYQESRKRFDTRKSGYRCLLASEVIQLLCIVPAFFELLGKDPGILDLTSVATKDPRIGEKIKVLSLKIQSEGGGICKVYQEIAEFLLEAIMMSNRPVLSGTKTQECQRFLESPSQSDVIEPSYIIISKQLIKSQERPQSCAGSVESRLQRCDTSCSRPRRSARAATALGMRTRQTVARGVQFKSTKRRPALGERVEVGHQTFGRLAAIPESNIGLVQLETLAAPKFQQADYVLLSQLDQQFTYINFSDIKWNAASETWKKVEPAGEVKRKKTTHSSKRSAFRCKSASVEGRGSEEGVQFLSDAIRQNLQLRVELPTSYDDSVLPTMEAFQTGRTVITDHVRSIVHECLQEADVQWTNCQPLDENGNVVIDDKDIELTVHDGTNMNNALPVAEVSVTMDSEPLRDDLIVGESIEHKSLNSDTVEEKGSIEDTSDEEDATTELNGLEEEMVSYTEHARINAWKTPEVIQKASHSGIPSRVGSATRLSTNSPAIPPPQRPSSPSHPGSIPLTQANKWLAGGRDISSARVKRVSVPLPGWMDGWEGCNGRRPKSSPASRGTRQSASSVISKPQLARPTTSTGRPMGGAAQVFVRGTAPPSFTRLPSARVMVRRR